MHVPLIDQSYSPSISSHVYIPSKIYINIKQLYNVLVYTYISPMDLPHVKHITHAKAK